MRLSRPQVNSELSEMLTSVLTSLSHLQRFSQCCSVRLSAARRQVRLKPDRYYGVLKTSKRTRRMERCKDADLRNGKLAAVYA
jgi:hypothetical protein